MYLYYLGCLKYYKDGNEANDGMKHNDTSVWEQDFDSV